MYLVYLEGIAAVVEKRKKQRVVSTNYMSSILKNRRLELNLTLEQVCQDICSVALLSKLERNLLAIDNDKTPLLCERVDLNYDELLTIEKGDKITKLLEAFYKEDAITIKEMYESNHNFFIAQEFIINAYYYLINYDYKKLQATIVKLDNVKESLNDKELFALMQIVVIYNIRIFNLNVANNYISLMEMLRFDEDVFSNLTQDLKFIIKCLQESKEVNYEYEIIKNNPKNNYLISKQVLMQIFYWMSNSTSNCLENILNLEEEYIPKKYNKIYLYAKAKLLMYHKNYMEVVKTIENVDIDYNILTIYGYAIMKLIETENNKELIKTYKTKLLHKISTTSQYQTDAYAIAFIKFIQMEIDKVSENTICEYLKNHLIREFKKFGYPFFANYVNQKYIYLLGKLCRYKDAYFYLNGIFEKLQLRY